jgi:hypothetical protein
LSEQLEREVNADELLKAQSKTKSVTSVAAAPPVTDPPAATAAPAEAPPPAIDEIPPAPREPEPVFGGLPPSATTPAAMHASDPHVADSKSTHE